MNPEGDLSETCSFSYAPMKKAMFKVLFLAVHKFKAHTMLSISPRVIYEVADAVETLVKLGIQIDWTNRILVEINKKQNLK